MDNIKVSSDFKVQTTKAIFSILLFLVTYITMLVLAVGLTILCVYGGFMLIAAKPMFVTIAIGIGLASLGVLVLFFLIKFIFKSHKFDLSHLTEVTKTDEPKLFEMIEDIVKKVGTNFPKKVYLSSDVNASVFYDSSFWSMFFPINKNLQIGIGLVNSITQSELKAILSHEFGHFSQKSMKVGSYVYNVNQVIFNMLFENESYDNMLQKWGSTSGYFSIFVIVAFKIIEGIKWLLREVYSVVNKNYMALSREMEFHADEIAANITGYEPLKQSLLRMSLVDHAYNSVLDFYDKKIVENQKSDNVFRDHLFVANFLAKDSNIEIKDDLPFVSEHDLNKFNKSKLIIKDQWASHPSLEDRIKMLEKTGLNKTELNNQPANLLFTNIEKIQTELTRKMFDKVVYSGECSVLPFEMFQLNYKTDFFENSFSKVYNGYYDNKNPLCFDVSNLHTTASVVELIDLFSENKLDEVLIANALQIDIQSIKQISNHSLGVKTFDYDGVKYSVDDCQELLSKLDKELEILNERIKLNDIEIFKHFLIREQKNNSKPKLQELYIDFFDYDKEFEFKYDIYVQLSNDLQFVSNVTPFEQIRLNFNEIKPLEEKMKHEIKELLAAKDCQDIITHEIKANFELYIQDNREYFVNENYVDDNLEILFSSINNYAFVLSRVYFFKKKKILSYQAELNERVPVMSGVES